MHWMMGLTVLGAAAGMIAALADRALSRSHARVLGAIARRRGRTVEDDARGMRVELEHEGLPLVVDYAFVPEREAMGACLRVRARWLLGAGPRFVAMPDNVGDHLPRADAVPLRARIERSYGIVGEHHLARSLLRDVLSRVPCETLPAPAIMGDPRVVAAWLPEPPRGPERERAIDELIALVAALARAEEERVQRLARELDGRVVLARRAWDAPDVPRIVVSTRAGEGAVEITSVRFGLEARTVASVAATRALPELAVDVIEGAVGAGAPRDVITPQAQDALVRAGRGTLRARDGRVSIGWGYVPDAAVLRAGIDAVASIAVGEGSRGVFR